MSGQTFHLRINVEIESRDERGYPDGRGRLQTSEQFEISPRGFTEVASILGAFHQLAQTVHDENPGCER